MTGPNRTRVKNAIMQSKESINIRRDSNAELAAVEEQTANCDLIMYLEKPHTILRTIS